MSEVQRRSSRLRRLMRPSVLVPTALGLAVLLAFGLYWFQPWKLWVDDTVNEALPVGAVTAAPTQAPVPASPAPPGSDASREPSASAPRDEAEDRVPPTTPSSRPAPDEAAGVLATGTFISHEHSTSGKALVLRLEDGSRVLRLEDLRTSNGPDLRVWLSDAPVKKGTAGWRVFDDGEYVELGRLKGNIGDQNYAIPSGVDLGALSSVTVWCKRFTVSFGAAALT